MGRWSVGGVFASGLVFFVGCGLNPQPEPPEELTPSGSAGTAGSSGGKAGAAGASSGGKSSGGSAGATAGFGGATGGGAAGKAGSGGSSAGSGGSSAGSGGSSTGGSAGSTSGSGGATSGGSAGSGGSTSGGGAGAGAGGSATGGAAGMAGSAGNQGGEAGAGGGGGAGAGGDGGAGGSVGGGGSGGSAGSGTALVSIAHLSPDAGDVEVCAKLGGAGSYIPAVATLTGNALTKLAYLDVTKRLSVPSGTHDLAVFAASAACAGTALFDVGPVTLAPDVAYTVVANGQTGAAPSTFAVDLLIDSVVADPSSAKVRFFHASPAAAALGQVDVLAKPESGAYSVLFSGVPFGAAAVTGGAGATVDANGYATLAPGAYSLGFVMTGAGLTPVVATSTPLPATAGLVATVYGTGATLATAASYACVESSQATNLLTCVTTPLQ